ncbi:MAG: 6-bladed beta-propeller [Vicingaceae bacterium]|nr:6-bladed beta-propeller [Vicingaceae bacterium]
MFLVATVIFAMGSCSPKLANTTNPQPKVFYPEIADSAKIQFLNSYSFASDIEKKRSKFQETILGEQTDFEIKKPYGVEIKNNKIYVSDVGIGGLIIIDLVKKTFNRFSPQGNGLLMLPVNSFIDSENNLYVADIKQAKILKYDSDGKFLLNFGLNENKAPSDLFVTNSNIFVCDSKNNRINVYQKDTHKLVDYFPKTIEGNDDWLYSPTNIYVKNNKVYVSDMGDASVKVYTTKGEFLNKVGSFGQNFGQFIRPKGVAVDNEENLYVVDGSFHNVQIFDKDGKLLLFFGGATGDRGGMYLPTSITIEYDVDYFKQFVDPNYDLKYLILVANQYGNYKVNVYGRVELKSND